MLFIHRVLVVDKDSFKIELIETVLNALIMIQGRHDSLSKISLFVDVDFFLLKHVE